MGVQTAPDRRSLISMSESAEQRQPNETLRAVRQSLLMSQGEFALAIRAAGQRAGEPNDCTKRPQMNNTLVSGGGRGGSRQ
jgi:hypothetical protein